MKKRLFAAIVLPADLRAELAAFGRREAAAWSGARWTAPEDLHVTVVFFGNVEEARLPELAAALGRAAAAGRPFELEYSEITLAPPRGDRRTMIWASFAKSADFSGLAETVRRAVGPFAPEMPEAKAPLPHATLARLKRPVQADNRHFGEVLPATRRFAAREITLFESHLGQSGPRYRPLAVFKTSERQSV